MKHLGTKRVETERLILRRFTIDDADAMFRNWANDPEVTKYLTWPAHPSVEVSRMVLESWVSQYDDNAVYQWAIVPRDIGEPVGSIGAVHGRDEIAMVHIGYCIGKNGGSRGSHRRRWPPDPIFLRGSRNEPGRVPPRSS